VKTERHDLLVAALCCAAVGLYDALYAVAAGQPERHQEITEAQA